MLDDHPLQPKLSHHSPWPTPGRQQGPPRGGSVAHRGAAAGPTAGTGDHPGNAILNAIAAYTLPSNHATMADLHRSAYTYRAPTRILKEINEVFPQ